MSSDGSEAALIGLDWGTSSLRAFLIGADGAVLDARSSAEGVLNVPDRDFEAVLSRHIQPWIEQRRLPIIASGMITSRNGWLETPYLSAPAGLAELARSLAPLSGPAGLALWFVTGVTTEAGGAPDVMRGEETQIVGAAGSGLGDGVYVTPGTHSKWISVKDGRIEDYATYMTGEIFGALRSHTILGALMADGPFSEDGFLRGVQTGLAQGDDLLRRLFSVRSLPLFGKIREDMTSDYLSGLLIGAEIKGALASGRSPEQVTIVGRGDLAERYDIALRQAGLSVRAAPETIAARGHFLIAQAAGLMS